jgi:hypothetical protein
MARHVAHAFKHDLDATLTGIWNLEECKESAKSLINEVRAEGHSNIQLHKGNLSCSN